MYPYADLVVNPIYIEERRDSWRNEVSLPPPPSKSTDSASFLFSWFPARGGVTKTLNI